MSFRPSQWCVRVLVGCGLWGGLLWGCQRSVPPPLTSATSPPAETAFPLSVQDDLGRRVRLVRPPERIVSLTPNLTEMVFALGLGDRLVGVSEYCEYPPEAREKPQVGGPATPNLERLVALKPDLVLAARIVPLEVLRQLDEMGLPNLAFDPRTLSDVLAHLRLIGRVAGIPQRAEALVTRLEQRVEAIVSHTQALPQAARPTVLLVFWSEPLMGYGPGSFGDDLICLAGGRNLLADAKQPYPVVNWELVVERNPEVILLAQPTGTSSLESQPGWSQLRAVRTGRVHSFPDPNVVLVPGPRLVDALEQMAHWLHPNLREP